jgi:hypothetical protein
MKRPPFAVRPPQIAEALTLYWWKANPSGPERLPRLGEDDDYLLHDLV